MRYGENFGALPLRALPRNPTGRKVKQVKRVWDGFKLSLVGVATTEPDLKSMEVQVRDGMMWVEVVTVGGWHYIYAGAPRCTKCSGKGYAGNWNDETMCERCNGSGENVHS